MMSFKKKFRCACDNVRILLTRVIMSYRIESQKKKKMEVGERSSEHVIVSMKNPKTSFSRMAF